MRKLAAAMLALAAIAPSSAQAAQYFLELPTLSVVGPFADQRSCIDVAFDLERVFGNEDKHPLYTLGCWEASGRQGWQFIATPTMGVVGPFNDQATCQGVAAGVERWFQVRSATACWFGPTR
jgi:hypothetical protein